MTKNLHSGGDAAGLSPPFRLSGAKSEGEPSGGSQPVVSAGARPSRPGILKTRDLFKLASSGPRFTTDAFTMQRRLPRDGEIPGETRFGITVTKRNFARAVTRNRIRRRFRAAIIAAMPGLPPGAHDFVLVAREAAVTIDFAVLTKEIARAATILATRDRPSRPRTGNRGEKPQKA